VKPRGGHIFLVAAAVLMLLALASIALAHEPYTGLTDPVYGNGCCGSEDCAILKVTPGMIEGEAHGYRIRMSAEQAAEINPYRKSPVDTLIVWERVQPSWDGNFHICLRTHDAMLPFGAGQDPRGAAYCFWAPPNT
jgi:hypothetical protein